jgi:Immunity protein 53
MASEVQLLTKLAAWYSEQCNGLWEHSHGIRIGTVDNPGWTVKVDLRETPFQDAIFEEIRVDNDENNWINCFKKDSIFTGAGDPSKIATILEIFLKFVGK